MLERTAGGVVRSAAVSSSGARRVVEFGSCPGVRFDESGSRADAVFGKRASGGPFSVDRFLVVLGMIVGSVVNRVVENVFSSSLAVACATS